MFMMGCNLENDFVKNINYYSYFMDLKYIKKKIL